MSKTNRIGSRVWYGRVAVVAISFLFASSVFAAQGYKVKKLVSDVPGFAVMQDSNLVNAWGINVNDEGTIWVANEVTHKATVYKQNGQPAPNADRRLVVDVPVRADEDAGPTGIVYNESDAFVITSGGASAPAEYIFATLGGTLVAWSGDVSLTQSFQVADRSGTGAVYTGLAISDEASGDKLFAANFAGREIDVFDGTFQFVTSFTDPNMEAGYSPFNVQAVGDRLFVAYAVVGDDGEEEAGAGLGIIDVFDFDGNVMQRFASHGTLNAPWGIALAPRNFGQFSNALIVGNFGDGHLSAFNMTTGEFLGQLADKRGEPIEIEGLWGIAFGTGAKSNTLFFAAGIDDETHGLFGSIRRQSNGQQ
jgi:uncharacterized protein (TIGR03118 family)